MSSFDVKVPSLGGFKEVGVIEVLVKPGDAVQADTSLVTLESDKATMDVPSPRAGTVKAISVKIGDRVGEGSLLLTLDAESAPETSAGPQAAPGGQAGEKLGTRAAPAAVPASPAPAAAVAKGGGEPLMVKVPSLGGFKEVGVIEVFVRPGQEVSPEASLVTLESDKATMDVPSPAGGRVLEVLVKVGDRVGEGTPLLTLAGAGAPAAEAPAAPAATPAAAPPTASAPVGPPAAPARAAPPPPAQADRGLARPPGQSRAHASPSVRQFARELGVDLALVPGTGPRGRIVKLDVERFVKGVMTGAVSVQAGGAAARGGTGLDLLPWPKVDFAQFGPVEARPLSRIKKISGANLARNWVMIPHVTQFDEADITELEAFRVRLNAENAKGGVKLTLLAFLVKACVAALKKFPELNASLDGESLVLKRYFNVGFAADTPQGLVVPVIKNADAKGLLDIAREAAELAGKAREGKLSAADMQGGCFSISSLGGIGGTAFTPIINAPEVAILGVSKGIMKPVWDGEKFAPRLTLPLSLSYDHRVIDGAQAARITSHLAQLLGDLRRLML